MYVSTADSRKGFPVLDHPRVESAHYQRSRASRTGLRYTLCCVTELREMGTLPTLTSPRETGLGSILRCSRCGGDIHTAHYQRSQSEVDRVRVHITPHTELREMVALDQGHI